VSYLLVGVNLIQNQLADKNLDCIATLIIFFGSFVFYYLGCIELLDAGFYEKINIAFDLDQAHYFYSVGKDMSSSSPLLIKHPFIYLYHYIVIILKSVGFSEGVAVILISKFFHSSSLVVSYFIFRCMDRSVLESSFLTFGLAGTSTYISTGLVLDVYSLSILWIAMIFLIVCQATYKNHEFSVWFRAAISVMAIGTTTYLIILVSFMELSLSKREDRNLINSLGNSVIYKQFFRIFSLGILLFFIVYFQMLYDVIQDPVGILKRVFWTVNRPGEKEGVLQVLSVFSIFSIVSPIISTIALPEGILMIDLRVMSFSFSGWCAVGMLLVSIFLKCQKNQNFVILLFCLTWLIINILFHTVYQYRGSLFLYCGHFILAVWILFVTQIDIEKIRFGWQKYFYKLLDKTIIYILPFIIWTNNIYLYKNIMVLM